MKLFKLGAPKELWNEDNCKEVGLGEIDLLAAHTGRGQSFANAKILNYGGMTYSITKFDVIKSIEEKVLGKESQIL